MSSSQSLVLKHKGLSTYSNPLNPQVVIDGSHSESLNIVIDRNEVAEPRRGFFQYGDIFGVSSDRTKQLINYKDTVLRHVLSEIQYDSDGTGNFLTFLGDAVNEIQAGLRIKYIEANGNLYFTSATGIKKISARNSADFPTVKIQPAGGVKALDLSATPNYSANGFLSGNSKVAYRLVWGYNDLNDNLILGAPSSRVVVYNQAATSCVVNISFPIPNEVDSTSFFYQLYRTGLSTAVPGIEPADPGDEMNLVLEDNPTSGELISRTVSFIDITPDDFRKNGTILYTNPTSGDGIESANDKPPFATDIALYKGYTFYSNTKTVQRLNLSVLSVQNLITNVSNFVVQDGITTNTYLFQGSIETYTVNFTGTAHADYVNVAPGTAKYFTLTSSSDERSYYVWYSESVNDQDPTIPGFLGIKVVLVGGDNLATIISKTAAAILVDTDDFNVGTPGGSVLSIKCANNGKVTVATATTIGSGFSDIKDGLGTGEDAASNKIFLPRVPSGSENGPTTSQQLEQVANSLVRVINRQDTIINAYYVSGFNDVPGQILFERKTTTGAPYYLTSNEGEEFNPTLSNSGTSVISQNEVRPNRIYYSKYQQPEAVPLANFVDIGPKDREIKRIIALRDSLFIFKEDGIYRLSGDTAPFTIAPFDFSSQVLAADTLVVLNNQIYGLSTQGVIVVTDTGVSVISRPIEDKLLKVIRQGFNYKTASFGVSYETDRSYLLWTVTQSTDIVATQAFRYNTFTNTWTRWDNTQTCGIVNFADDKMYLGAGDKNFIEKERKTLTRKDYADRQFDRNIQLNGIIDTLIKLNSVSEIFIGDVLIQTQYLTADQFNRLLLKLDIDPEVADQNYYSLLKYLAGTDMRAKLVLLAQKLDLDPGVNDSDYFSSIDNYTYSITANTAVSQTVITIGAHNIKAGRYISISGSNSTPSINGTFEVLSVTGTTITINKNVTIAGTSGTLQTAVNDFRDMQACFNIINNKLNNDSTVFFTNYPLSTDTFDFEVVILDYDIPNNTVMVDKPEMFLFGSIVLYKAIQSTIIWNPQYFQDPSIKKQVREGSMMFENSNFSLIKIAYASDINPSFVENNFYGSGPGDWGQFPFGTINWGGIAAAIPLRTYIPADKQRCTYLVVRFKHRVAFEKYSHYGMSLTFRPYSTRVNR